MDSETTSDSFFEQLLSFQVVEGLSNDVLVVFVVLGCILAYFARSLLAMIGSDRRNSYIHPEAEGAISETRRQMFGASGADPAQIRRNGPDAMCPICLGQPIRLPVETNCGHVFCGRCFTTYCAYGGAQLQPIRCPVCRQRVTLLLPGFTVEEARSLSQADCRAVLDPLREYNRRFSGEPRSWTETILDLPTLLRHLIGALFSESGLALVIRLRVMLILLLAAAYLLSPIDLLPEGLVGVFGLIDDLFIFFLLAVYVTMIYRRNAAANPQFLGPEIDGDNDPGHAQ